LEQKIDDLKNEKLVKDDQIRRLQFETEKHEKMAAISAKQ